MTDTEAVDQSTSAGDVPIEEPPLPRRTRRPIDGLRLLVWSAVLTAVVALAVLAESSFQGLATDLDGLGEQIPSPFIGLLDGAAQVAGIALPPVLVVILMLRGRVRTTVELLVAGLVAAGTSALAGTWLLPELPERVQDAFEPIMAVDVPPVPPYPALLVAVVTVISRLDMTRINQVALFAISGAFAVDLLRGEGTVAGTVVALSIGRIVGMAVRMVSGLPSVSPSGRRIADVLEQHGHTVLSVRADPFEEHRRYIAETTEGPLGVLVLDRDKEGAGMLVRLVDRLRTREEVLPRESATMRQAIDQSTLLSLAVTRAGARTPRLRNVVRLGPDAALLVHDHIPGQPLAKLSADEVTDEVLTDLWQQIDQLRRNEVAHRRLSVQTILVGEDNKVWLLSPSGGEVAAPDLALRTDLAQALVSVAMVAGAQRAVDSAVKVLGADVVAGAVPLLQPLALARNTRQWLRGKRVLLGQLRDKIVSEVGWEPGETVRLARIRPLSLVTGLGAAVGVYLVGTQLTDVGEIGRILAAADWRWLIVAVIAMALQYVGATFALLGFVPERVRFDHALGAQVTLSFVRLIAPATVGITAINARLLTKAGVGGPLAAASIAANQVGAVAVTLPLIAGLGVLSGSRVAPGLQPSATTLIIIGLIVLVGGLVVLAPPIRRRAMSIWRDFAQRGLPRLLDVVSRPRKLAEAIGGILLQTLSLVMCFYACVRALGADPSLAALAVVQMVGNSVGMAVPTPGGLGAVEAALTAGVTTIGVSTAVAVPAVLLFRLVSFWLPILPGWILWTQLQRREIL
ncbi:MAG: flippase-like domain-containing protein [Actinomycetota bacterium]